MQIVPMRDMKNTVMIENLCEKTHSPVFVTKNGYGKLVVMDIDTFERLTRGSYEAWMINEAIEEFEEGRTVDGAEVIEGVRSKYGL